MPGKWCPRRRASPEARCADTARASGIPAGGGSRFLSLPPAAGLRWKSGGDATHARDMQSLPGMPQSLPWHAKVVALDVTWGIPCQVLATQAQRAAKFIAIERMKEPGAPGRPNQP